MSLLDKKREEHLSRALRRIGSVLVCISLLLALAFPPPPARAIAIADDAAVAALVAAFLSSCGMTFSASGMDTNGVKEQIGSVLDGYLNEMFDGQSPLQWLGEFTLGYGQGKIVLPAGVANKLVGLAEWVRREFGVSSAQPAVVYRNRFAGIPLQNGGYFALTICGNYERQCYLKNLISLGDVLHYDDLPIYFANGCSFQARVDGYYYLDFYDSVGNRVFSKNMDYPSMKTMNLILVCFNDSDVIYNASYDETGSYFWTYDFYSKYLLSENTVSVDESLVISSADSISIPNTVSDTQELAISTGSASDLTLDQALEQILAAIAEGQLSATREITEAGTAVDDPSIPIEETMPDVEELGLPSLANTLTTRFPFSIPWDVAKAVKLLAAPPKTPRFEVDFFAPISDYVGGWQGSTAIVIDFSEIELLGQLSRWTSTIGFCLMLASGTKKLIWTA